MNPIRGKHNFLAFCVALLLLAKANFSFAGTGLGNQHFQFPHFFAQSPDNAESYVLRFNKGLMKFADKQVFFQVIQSKSNGTEIINPESIMQVPDAISENVSLEFVNANSCIPTGSEPLASRSNYFLGNNSNNWKQDLQNYNALQYQNLYNNIDLKYYMLNDEVKYDYTIHPGGSIADIEMKYSGIESLTVDKNGTLCIQTQLTVLKDYLPKSYQLINGVEIPVKVRYRLTGKYSVGFIADDYDQSYPLIIDPALIYSTFVGGSADDFEYTGGISLDATGNIYVTGRTYSADFPTTAGVIQAGYGGNLDAFVFKLNPTGTALIFSTFVGGNDVDGGYTTKIDPVTNDIYVGGTTSSVNFPTTAGAYQTAYGGGITDPFSFKLNASGSAFIYSTLLGNAQDDYGSSIDIDNFGNVYFVGQTSGPYPTTAGAYQSVFAGGPWDVFVSKINPTGTGIIFSTLLGGPSEDHSHSIKVDANYEIYIEGMAKAGFPTTAGAYDMTFNGGQWDMWVAKMNSTGTALHYSTYVGGPGADWTWNSFEIDNLGNAYCTGYVQSGFPTTAGSYQTVYGGGTFDVGFFKLNPTGSALVFSTYIGGPGDDEGWGISLNPNNEAFITGLCSFGYPYTPCAWDTTFNGVQDAFITYVNSTGSALIYSSYIGGAAYDQGYNIIDVGNLVYVAGATSSVDFPHTAGAYDTTANGLKDVMVFVMDISGVNTVTADFNSATHICLNELVVFNNMSLNATSYYWDFDDGSTSTLQNPIHAFATSGQYDVMLIASASCAAPDTFIVQVTIVDPPTAAFNSNIPCGLTANFIDASAGAISYSWDFGDAGTSALSSPSHTYATDGNYVVTLIITSIGGCSDTVQQQITISPLAVAAFTIPPPQCTLDVSLQNTSVNATNYSWDFGDGTTSTNANPSHTYSDTGSYVITLIANPGVCADTVFQTVSVHLPPTASFTDQPGCNLNCDFLNTTQGAISFSWNFGDGATSSATSPSHTYSVDGNYTITLIANNAYGCSDTIITQVNIDPVPVAAFTSSSQCSLNASFQNTSVNSNSVTWYFGDGSSSATDSPLHTYADTGTYSVMLIVNPNLCPDTIIQTVSIHTAPVASFTSVTQCNLSCDFVNNSNGGTSYAWDFGDAQTSTLVSPSHVYALDGNYSVTLIVQNTFGCSDTILQQVQINPVPVAGFSFPPPLCTMQVSFQNTSQNGTAYSWDFGDGSISAGTDVTHTYTTSGNFLITLITNPGACADTATQSVTVHDVPVSAFSGITSCDLEYTCINNSFGGVSYLWDFGDAGTSTSVAPSHTYSFAGNYLITLITTDQYGCNDTSQQNVTINDNPVAAFTDAAQPCDLDVPFQNSSVNATSYLWDFGDGTTSTDLSPGHSYLYSGTYNVTLIINPGACSDTMLQSVTVSHPSVVNFSSVNTCTFDVQFQNTTDSANIYTWDFGDGSTSSDQSPLHSYSSVGGQDVTLIGMNSSGCADTVTQHIEIVIFVPAAFVPVYDTCFMQAQFISTSVNSGNYYWDFGDGTSSNDQSVIHQYPYPGNFEMLFITNRGTECADTLAETFDAAPPPEHSFYIPNCFTPNGDGLNDRFSVLDFGNCYVYHLTIFDRWGEVIFETDDLNESWDGRYKGKPVPEDVYAYLLKGKDKIKQGSVLVLMK